MLTKKITEVFGLRLANNIKNLDGEPIQIPYLDDRTDGSEKYLPKRNEAYLFDADTVIPIALAMGENIPGLVWGPHGSGKSTILEQFCNRTNRPCLRVQHSVDTERADIVGQWVLEGDKTVFHYGPLARAMIYGLVYIADEYDFALPNVLAAYQAVMEGEPLVIPNAPEHMAIVKPHPDFRFFATGNTNGGGDETGLYQGTQLQNAANYSRFGVTVHMDYAANEKKIITGLFGEIPERDLKLLTDFASSVRTAYKERTITNTLSTRELLNITRLAIFKGRDKLNFRFGIEKGFTGRMSSIDSAAIGNIVSRIFP